MLSKTGIPTTADISKITPPEERLAQGPVAVIECFQEIPCNPCWEACPNGAVQEMSDMNKVPQIDYTKCNGCGICATRCPGLAIFIVDASFSPAESVVRLPYEFYPLPEADELVTGVNRAGEEVGKFRVLRVQQGSKQNKTALIWLVVPRELCMEVRNIRYKGVENHG
ncbi:MAG: 4Fe-4S binding protein [Peptococcaceae bacterium]